MHPLHGPSAFAKNVYMYNDIRKNNVYTRYVRIPRFRAHAGSSRASVLKRLGRLVLEFRGFLVSGLEGWNIICSKEGLDHDEWTHLR